MTKSKFVEEFNALLQFIGGIVVLALAIAFFEWAKAAIFGFFAWAICLFFGVRLISKSAKNRSLIELIIGVLLLVLSGFVVALFFGRMGLPRAAFIPFSVIYSCLISFAAYRIASRIHTANSIEEQRKIFNANWIHEFLTEKPTNNYWVLVNFLKHHAIPLIGDKELVASTLKKAENKLDWGAWIGLYEAKVIDAVLILPPLNTTFPLGKIVNLYQDRRRINNFALCYEGDGPSPHCLILSVEDGLYEACKYARLLALLSVYEERNEPIPEAVESIAPDIAASFFEWFKSIASLCPSVSRIDNEYYVVNQ